MERRGREPPPTAAHQVETDDQTALVSKRRNKGGNSGLASAGFNIVNSIIGSGIIGLPYSMKEAGFPLGVLLLFVVAYITVGADNVLTDRNFIILLTTIIFTLPISLYQDIAKLGKVSLSSLILTIVILIIVMVRTVTLSPQVPKSENAWIFAKSNAVQAVGVMSFAFICNHNSFLIYGSLEEPTLKNWSRVTHASVSLAVVISVAFAACGYMTFTGYTEGDCQCVFPWEPLNSFPYCCDSSYRCCGDWCIISV